MGENNISGGRKRPLQTLNLNNTPTPCASPRPRFESLLRPGIFFAPSPPGRRDIANSSDCIRGEGIVKEFK
ncbi:hypothetical protein MUK42_34793 [Musa troglodytarum]|uniref:Uncharacterized protein n=1 Tax=Musa troglodytarum TaxID=320322 RepID=A0A9E7GBF8_9LILI|nr:hypothetical protein MUK42_34793 [Musa troglodytarum]